MVTKISNNINVDTHNALDFWGVENDYIYVVNTIANEYSTWAGNDVIDASQATFVSNLTTTFYTGAGDDQVLGTGGKDWIFDGAGNDFVMAGAGDDRVHADLGNDIFYGGAGKDMIDFRYTNVLGPTVTAELYTEGVTFDLANHGVQNLGLRGFDQVFGFEDINGSTVNDFLYGDNGANGISGNDGDDYLDGRAGADLLSGDMGSDILIGRAGADTFAMLEILPARDSIRYFSFTDSGTTAGTYDIIQNFDKGGGLTDDKIDLSRLDASLNVAGNQAFTFNGSAGFHLAGGEVRLVTQGANTLVYIDNDADAAVEMVIKVEGVTGLTKADFIL